MWGGRKIPGRKKREKVEKAQSRLVEGGVRTRQGTGKRKMGGGGKVPGLFANLLPPEREKKKRGGLIATCKNDPQTTRVETIHSQKKQKHQKRGHVLGDGGKKRREVHIHIVGKDGQQGGKQKLLSKEDRSKKS